MLTQSETTLATCKSLSHSPARLVDYIPDAALNGCSIPSVAQDGGDAARSSQIDVQLRGGGGGYGLESECCKFCKPVLHASKLATTGCALRACAYEMVILTDRRGRHCV